MCGVITEEAAAAFAVMCQSAGRRGTHLQPGESPMKPITRTGA